jgi:hypothetical protein
MLRAVVVCPSRAYLRAERRRANCDETRSCSYCGTRFGWIRFYGDVVEARGIRYCCGECAHDADLKRRRQTYLGREPGYCECAWCGGFFIARAGAAYCSGSHRVAAHRARKRAANGELVPNAVATADRNFVPGRNFSYAQSSLSSPGARARTPGDDAGL